MLHEISDERYCFIEDTICDAFLLVLKEKGIEKNNRDRHHKKSRNCPQYIL